MAWTDRKREFDALRGLGGDVKAMWLWLRHDHVDRVGLLPSLAPDICAARTEMSRHRCIKALAVLCKTDGCQQEHEHTDDCERPKLGDRPALVLADPNVCIGYIRDWWSLVYKPNDSMLVAYAREFDNHPDCALVQRARADFDVMCGGKKLRLVPSENAVEVGDAFDAPTPSEEQGTPLPRRPLPVHAAGVATVEPPADASSIVEAYRTELSQFPQPSRGDVDKLQPPLEEAARLRPVRSWWRHYFAAVRLLEHNGRIECGPARVAVRLSADLLDLVTAKAVSDAKIAREKAMRRARNRPAERSADNEPRVVPTGEQKLGDLHSGGRK